VHLTLEDALARAKKNSTQFQAAVTDAAIAREDRSQARDCAAAKRWLNTGAIYTQGNGAGNPVRYIANNAVTNTSVRECPQVIDFAAFANFAGIGCRSCCRARAEMLRGSGGHSRARLLRGRGCTTKGTGSADNRRRGRPLSEIDTRPGTRGKWLIPTSLKPSSNTGSPRQLQEAQLALLNARLDSPFLMFPDFNDNFERALAAVFPESWKSGLYAIVGELQSCRLKSGKHQTAGRAALQECELRSVCGGAPVLSSL